MSIVLSQTAWSGYSAVRSRICTLDESQYERLYDLLTPEKSNLGLLLGDGMPEKVIQSVKVETVKQWVAGLERVHRLLMEARKDGTIRLTDGEESETPAP